MAYQYKRRRPSIIRNFWVYRRLIGMAMLLGLMLWFIWANDKPATVAFPFGLGKLESTIGMVILLSALVGSVMTILATTVFFALRRLRSYRQAAGPAQPLRRDRGPAAAGLCRKNLGRLSESSLVKLTKKDDGNLLLILSQRDRGTILSPGPVHPSVCQSPRAATLAGDAPRSGPRRRPMRGGRSPPWPAPA